MNLLVVINDAMFEDNYITYVENSTGVFLVDLLKYAEKLSLFHFKMSFNQTRRLADFRISDRGINIVNIPWGKSKFLNYLKASHEGYKCLKNADFIYVFYPGHLSLIICLLAIIRNKRFGMYVRGEKGISSGLSKFFYKRAQVILTVSNQFTDQIKTFGGNAQTIRPMINYSEIDIVMDRKYEQKVVYRLLYVGRLETRKGIYDLIWAANRLKELELNNFVLDIVGDGPEAVEIMQLVVNLGLSEKVHFHGSVSEKDQLKKYYLNSDLFVFPSHDEGFPRVIYEASIFGLPIATTFVGTINYLMKDKVNCYNLPLKQPQQMGDTLFDIINQYSSVTAIAQNATKTVFEYLNDNKYSHGEQLLNAINAI